MEELGRPRVRFNAISPRFFIRFPARFSTVPPSSFLPCSTLSYEANSLCKIVENNRGALPILNSWTLRLAEKRCRRGRIAASREFVDSRLVVRFRVFSGLFEFPLSDWSPDRQSRNRDPDPFNHSHSILFIRARATERSTIIGEFSNK